MDGEKIGRLNFAIEDAIPAMRDAAASNANAQLRVRVVTFSSGARWHVAEATDIEQFSWTAVTAGGVTDMGQAIRLVAEQLQMPPMEQRALPPILALISDGQPTDDFAGALAKLDGLPWGKKAVRIAIGVGQDTDLDVLGKFIGPKSELRPLEANNAQELVNYIKWVSTAVINAASAPASGSGQDDGLAVPIPQPPAPGDGNDVW